MGMLWDFFGIIMADSDVPTQLSVNRQRSNQKNEPQLEQKKMIQKVQALQRTSPNQKSQQRRRQSMMRPKSNTLSQIRRLRRDVTLGPSYQKNEATKITHQLKGWLTEGVHKP
ncbi:hypothetical protein H9L19_04215 [Weissella diestrammenae]|uniref:Uncharacterized protein n=1 Tax=Weissella diestrammenae TaxID=1162633 RepID=A0A7G9T3H1_9LACO|nr:hypothetical protein [Weissella diestrammenae]MCM0582104.1 hypothetical protein [Weissella diestrammenae]QNN74646.1 hypothetical protein H9L19_04215 [Weissella diestrammenae]